MFICSVLTLIGLAVLVFYVKEKSRAYSVKALILKSVGSCFFIAVGFCALYANPGRAGLFILGGLVCGIMGDVWLDLKYVYPADDTPYTFSGFIFFAIGHVVFISGMILDFGMDVPVKTYLLTALVCIVLGFGTVLSGPLLKLDYGKYKGISMLYAPLLFGTPLVALILARAGGFANTGFIMIAVGGVLFALSDLVLSGTFFGKGKERLIDFILNYAFYYGAQFVIAFAILFI